MFFFFWNKDYIPFVLAFSGSQHEITDISIAHQDNQKFSGILDIPLVPEDDKLSPASAVPLQCLHARLVLVELLL